MPRTIAIDGPAGAGKSTIGALVAERLGYLFLDTGAMYRAVALAASRRGIDPDDAGKLSDLAKQVRITIGPPTKQDGRAYTVLLDGSDVTWDIRSADIDRIVSQVARVAGVRDASERARRREEELASRGDRRPRQELLHEILRRDQLDTERAVSPLKAAEDAIVVQTDGLSVREALDKVLAAIQRP